MSKLIHFAKMLLVVVTTYCIGDMLCIQILGSDTFSIITKLATIITIIIEVSTMGKNTPKYVEQPTIQSIVTGEKSYNIYDNKVQSVNSNSVNSNSSNKSTINHTDSTLTKNDIHNTPLIPILEREHFTYECPCCHAFLSSLTQPKECEHCGQRLKWETYGSKCDRCDEDTITKNNASKKYLQDF